MIKKQLNLKSEKKSLWKSLEKELFATCHDDMISSWYELKLIRSAAPRVNGLKRIVRIRLFCNV